jgi:hypothetical protein
MKRALESEHVSAHLVEWIDLIWGFWPHDNIFYPYLYEDMWTVFAREPGKVAEIEGSLDTCGQIPQQLFVDQHPPRLPHAAREPLGSAAVLPCDIENLQILATRGRKLLCRDATTVYVITVRLKKATARPLKTLPEAGLIVASATSVAAVLKNGDVVMFSVSQPSQPLLGPVEGDVGKVSCLSTSGHIACIGWSDTSITLVQAGVAVQTFSSFRDHIHCSACSAAFDLVVVGASSTLFLISASRRSITRVLTLADVDPVLVEVTSGWGFIVVYEVGDGEMFVEVLTANGDFVRKVKLGAQISAWSTWCSADGFDYLVICPKHGKIRICEVFWLTFRFVQRPVYGANSVFYIPRLEAVFVGQPDGYVLMIPHRIGE